MTELETDVSTGELVNGKGQAERFGPSGGVVVVDYHGVVLGGAFHAGRAPQAVLEKEIKFYQF